MARVSFNAVLTFAFLALFVAQAAAFVAHNHHDYHRLMSAKFPERKRTVEDTGFASGLIGGGLRRDGAPSPSIPHIASRFVPTHSEIHYFISIYILHFSWVGWEITTSNLHTLSRLFRATQELYDLVGSRSC